MVYTRTISNQLIYICTLAVVVFIKEFQWDQRINHSTPHKLNIYFVFLKKIFITTETETQLSIDPALRPGRFMVLMCVCVCSSHPIYF